MSPPPPLGHRSPLKEGTLRARGKVAIRRRGTVRERKSAAPWHPRIRIPSNGKGGPGAPKASLNTPALDPHSPLAEQMRIRAPNHTRRGPGAPKAKSNASYNSPTLDPHSPLVEETAKKILNITRKLKKLPENPKQKESALKRFLKSVFFLTQPLFANTPHLERGSVNVPFKGALVPLGPPRRGPGPGARVPGFNSSGAVGPVIEPNFMCPAGSQPGAGGVCVPIPPKPTETQKQKIHHQLCGVCSRHGSPIQDCPYFKEFLRTVKKQTWEQWKDNGDIHEYRDWLCSKYSKCVDIPED
jgi:hypothetical protein